MHTKQQIQQLLTSQGVRPNKRLGQHFLIDLNLMRFLIKSAEIKTDDVVLEVGCGTGSLTAEIANHAAKVITVEYDRVLAAIAKEQLASLQNVTLINDDILHNKNSINSNVTKAIKESHEQYNGRFILLANLPYHVSSAIMINLIVGPLIADAMYVTVQKEVADRMTAPPGGRDYGTLSIFMAATGKVKNLRILKPSVFWPHPKVNSTVISFVRRDEKADKIKNINLLGNIIELFMGHRRKMLNTSIKFARGALENITDWQTIFEQNGINPQNRPEQLSPEDYVAIANCCDERLR